ncbi:hypothetical protein [Streptomyces sp. NPDC048489]|uniref:hypothetical protein n=1 Tax=Streptomyces sp. NPDC048489 TaxID=3154504 RepID=UPI00342CB31B
MTDTTAPAQHDPTGTPVPGVPEQPGICTPAVPATQPIANGRARRRVRIDHLRRVVIETREYPAYRFTVRDGAYIVGGTRILTRRAWDSRTTARHERFMRAADAAGQEDVARGWEQRAYIYRQSRHRRRMEMLQLATYAPKAVAIGTAGGAGVLLILGILLAWANQDAQDVLTPIRIVVDLIGWTAGVAGGIRDPLLYSLPWIAHAGVWAVARHWQTAPTWALPAEPEQRDIVPDEGAILRALCNLGIAPLNKAIKEGGSRGGCSPLPGPVTAGTPSCSSRWGAPSRWSSG